MSMLWYWHDFLYMFWHQFTVNKSSQYLFKLRFLSVRFSWPRKKLCMFSIGFIAHHVYGVSTYLNLPGFLLYRFQLSWRKLIQKMSLDERNSIRVFFLYLSPFGLYIPYIFQAFWLFQKQAHRTVFSMDFPRIFVFFPFCNPKSTTETNSIVWPTCSNTCIRNFLWYESVEFTWYNDSSLYSMHK